MKDALPISRSTVDACIVAFQAMNRITATIKTAPTFLGANNELLLAVPDAAKNHAVVANGAAIDALAGLLDALRDEQRKAG